MFAVSMVVVALVVGVAYGPALRSYAVSSMALPGGLGGAISAAAAAASDELQPEDEVLPESDRPTLRELVEKDPRIVEALNELTDYAGGMRTFRISAGGRVEYVQIPREGQPSDLGGDIACGERECDP